MPKNIVNINIGSLSESDIKRFWSRVNITAQKNLCWEWNGALNRGYGRFSLNYKQKFMANRLSYCLSYNVEIGDLLVCHKCDKPKCCNPDHLFLGTSKDNSQDMVKKGRHPKKEDRWSYKNPEFVTGENNPASKLTAIQIAEIREKGKPDGVTYKQLGDKYGITRSHICGILKGRYWEKS